MYTFLIEVTIDLYADNGVSRAFAIPYAEKNGSDELEQEAMNACISSFSDDETDAQVLAYGDQDDADTIRHKYPLLDAYLEKAFEEM